MYSFACMCPAVGDPALLSDRAQQPIRTTMKENTCTGNPAPPSSLLQPQPQPRSGRALSSSCLEPIRERALAVLVRPLGRLCLPDRVVAAYLCRWQDLHLYRRQTSGRKHQQMAFSRRARGAEGGKGGGERTNRSGQAPSPCPGRRCGAASPRPPWRAGRPPSRA